MLLLLVSKIGSASLGFRVAFSPVSEHLQVLDRLVMENVGSETKGMPAASIPSTLKLLRS